MADKKLNEVTTVSTGTLNNVKNFLAVMNDGSIQQMSKEDMASVVGGLLDYGITSVKRYGETMLDGNGTINIGKFNGIIYIKQRSASDLYVPYIVSDTSIKQLAGEERDYSFNLVKENGELKIKGNGSIVQIYITYRAFGVEL